MSTRPYPSFLIYKDSRGEYRWKLQASNTKIIADSGEGYARRADCVHGMNLVMDTNRNTPVWHTEDAKV
jgi:uncharacterized protein YegP (UPF0339 family)